MSDAAPPPPPVPPAPASGPERAPEVRPPRKRFILIGFGIGVLVIVLIGLFTSIGSGQGSSGTGSGGGQVQAGDPVPTFTKANIGPAGPRLVHVSATGRATGTPTVLLFFGAWCSACHQELPPVAAAVQKQQKAGGALGRIRVVGVDSLDTIGDAKSFIASAGVTFPVAYDYDAVVTQNDFGFHGDPYTVFVKADGTVAKVVAGAQLTPASFRAAERQLIPSGT